MSHHKVRANTKRHITRRSHDEFNVNLNLPNEASEALASVCEFIHDRMGSCFAIPYALHSKHSIISREVQRHETRRGTGHCLVSTFKRRAMTKDANY